MWLYIRNLQIKKKKKKFKKKNKKKQENELVNLEISTQEQSRMEDINII